MEEVVNFTWWSLVPFLFVVLHVVLVIWGMKPAERQAKIVNWFIGITFGLIASLLMLVGDRGYSWLLTILSIGSFIISTKFSQDWQDKPECPRHGTEPEEGLSYYHGVFFCLVAQYAFILFIGPSLSYENPSLGDTLSRWGGQSFGLGMVFMIGMVIAQMAVQAPRIQRQTPKDLASLGVFLAVAVVLNYPNTYDGIEQQRLLISMAPSMLVAGALTRCVAYTVGSIHYQRTTT